MLNLCRFVTGRLAIDFKIDIKLIQTWLNLLFFCLPYRISATKSFKLNTESFLSFERARGPKSLLTFVDLAGCTPLNGPAILLHANG